MATCWGILSGLGQADSVNVPFIESVPSFKEFSMDCVGVFVVKHLVSK